MSDVAIIMGSDSDWPTMEAAANILDEFGISYTAEVISAHRMPDEIGESFVDFWFPRAVEGELRIKGKIKALRGDKTTALNYVKITG